ncbi:MAG TPA: alpha-L-fucosidase [Armatimonadota bacterium]|nr:alpha-L-fucosidase [Armatimonadota bacterium]
MSRRQQEAGRDMKTPEHMTWFLRDRFGMFIHWGLYALPARHEWIKNMEEMDDERYERYFRQFDPDLYDPEEWADRAAAAGMKYMVVTSKHHEGFCLWDSKLTDYKATNTPAGRDLLRPVLEAFRARGLKVGLYHSLIDWHHPDFLIDDVHPMRNHPDKQKLNEGRDPKRYAEYLHGQVRELLTEYGRIDVMFYDFSYPKRDEQGKPQPWLGKGREEWESEKLLAMTRELQPGIVVNDRLDLIEAGGWDYRSPEQYVPREGVMMDGKAVPWEACHTFSGSWGYHREEASWKSGEQLVQLLIDTVSKGGNVLLNVGPTARGEFDYRAIARLEGMGEWMKRHGRSIYGCGPAPEGFTAPQDCRLTYNAETNRVYVHVFAWPIHHLHLEGMAGKVAYAQLLNDGSEVKMIEGGPRHLAGPVEQGERSGLVTLELPIRKPEVTVPVVEVWLK